MRCAGPLASNCLERIATTPCSPAGITTSIPSSRTSALPRMKVGRHAAPTPRSDTPTTKRQTHLALRCKASQPSCLRLSWSSPWASNPRKKLGSRRWQVLILNEQVRTLHLKRHLPTEHLLHPENLSSSIESWRLLLFVRSAAADDGHCVMCSPQAAACLSANGRPLNASRLVMTRGPRCRLTRLTRVGIMRDHCPERYARAEARFNALPAVNQDELRLRVNHQDCAYRQQVVGFAEKPLPKAGRSALPQLLSWTPSLQVTSAAASPLAASPLAASSPVPPAPPAMNPAAQRPHNSCTSQRRCGCT